MRILILLVLIAVLSSVQAQTITPSERVNSSVLIKQQPNKSASIVGRLYPNETAKLLSKTSYYYKIEKSSGLVGYVPKSWTVLSQQAKHLKIHFINVGQGDATLINCPNNKNILIDMGTSTHSVLTDYSAVESYVKSALVGTKAIDTFFITHPDKDHYVLADNILSDTKIDNVFYVGSLGSYDADKGDFEAWFKKINSKKYKLNSTDYDNELTPNSTVNCGDAEIHILAANTPPKSKPEWKSNASSIVLMLRYGDFEAIFTGDATFAAEELVVKRFDNDWLNVELYKLGHHGSSTTSNSLKWMNVLKPNIIIGSSSDSNSYGHPRKKVVARANNLDDVAEHDVMTGSYVSSLRKSLLTVEQSNKAVFTTATNGNIVITTDGNKGQYEVNYDNKSY